MKHKLIIYSAILVFLVGGLGSCYRDVIAPSVAQQSAPPQFVSFSHDLQSIFSANCALSGCHVSGSQNPNLSAGSAYQSLTSGGFINTVVPTQSIIYQEINGQMMVHIPAASDRQKIYDWIRNGAPNN